MDIDYGTGLTASCVLTPPFNCNGRKYNSNYIKIKTITSRYAI